MSEAGLVAPEAMLLHKSMGLVNAMISLIKFGYVASSQCVTCDLSC